MYEEDLGKLLLKQSETVLAHLAQVTLTFVPVIRKSIGFLCYTGWMCRTTLGKVGQGVLELLIRNSFITFDPCDLDLWYSDPNINIVLLLHRMIVLTKFEEGMSRRSWVIDRKQKGYRRTDRPTCSKPYALSSSKGGHKNMNVNYHYYHYFI